MSYGLPQRMVADFREMHPSYCINLTAHNQDIRLKGVLLSQEKEAYNVVRLVPSKAIFVVVNGFLVQGTPVGH